ncbi:MAG: phosphoglucosamine mutase [Deltaproteobacteria bacterium]|nr:phosphoglucosamine mutase [Deltaproteobacteria bacterium]
MGRLFGTDGIRGIANQDPITKKMGHKLGHAVVRFCQQRGISTSIVIGRDTRASGEMLEHAVVSGVISAGGNACQVGVLPTPGVAYLTRELAGGAGIVLSASHNPQEYNGFKLFSREGFKLSDEEESEIEDLILEQKISPTGERGRAEVHDDAGGKYISFLLKTVPEKFQPQDIKVVMDCANGATFRVAPVLFQSLGFNAEALFANPDGRNINKDCGSQHTEALSRRVLEAKADAGLAFDGDGDRVIAVDEKGRALAGDQILMICAKMLREKGRLKNNIVVSTVMSNIGLRSALKGIGIEHVSTRVGDRYVMEEMRTRKSSLGGEESGHIIFSDHHTTGDGLLAALQLLYATKISGQTLSELSSLMTVYPQTLTNVPVGNKPDISEVPALVKIIRDTEQELGDEGRVLVRYSGTEPVCRVMVEGKRREEIEAYARDIADVITRQLNP